MDFSLNYGRECCYKCLIQEVDKTPAFTGSPELEELYERMSVIVSISAFSDFCQSPIIRDSLFDTNVLI